MPGIDPDKDVSLDIEGNVLTISGERREEKKEKNRHELHYGSFTRSIPLPRDVKTDEIKATYVDGVLEVRVPAMVAEHKPLKVPVERKEELRPQPRPQPIVSTAAPVTRPAARSSRAGPPLARSGYGVTLARTPSRPASASSSSPSARVFAVTLVRVRSRNRCRW